MSVIHDRTVKTLEQKLAAVAVIDLSLVGRKLMEPAPEGKSWGAEQVAEAEKWYRRYLSIIVKYPDHIHVPNSPIDTFWHQHILDTKAYAADCQAIFGFFLHHYPYFGLGGDKTELNECFRTTNDLYREMFGEDCMNMPAFGIIPGSLAAECESNCGAGEGTEVLAGSVGCGDKGSGTGCRQGCKRGG